MNIRPDNLQKAKKLLQPYSSSASYLSSLDGKSKYLEDSLSQELMRTQGLANDEELAHGLQPLESKSEVNKSHPFLK
jgi:hypothetical protein